MERWIGGGCSCVKPEACLHRQQDAFSMTGAGRRALKAKGKNARGAQKDSNKRKRYGRDG